MKRVITFLDMPGEIRNRIYELLLVDEMPIHPSFSKISARGLFYANTQISRESIYFFYSQNWFDFTSQSEKVIKFLDLIGRRNAGMIEKLYLNFSLLNPNVAVQDYCHRLKKIILPVGDIMGAVYELGLLDGFDGHDALYDLNTVRKALDPLENCFRAIKSLHEVSFVVYETGYSILSEDELFDHMRTESARRGWKLSPTKFYGYEDDDYHAYYSDYDYYSGIPDSHLRDPEW